MLNSRVNLHPFTRGEYSSDTDDTQQSSDPQAAVPQSPATPVHDEVPDMPMHHTLRFTTLINPRHMRNATPEQRLRALREHRAAHRATNAPSPHAPRIRGTRLTRLFRRDTGTAGTQTTESPAEARSPQVSGPPAPAEGNSSSSNNGAEAAPSNSQN